VFYEERVKMKSEAERLKDNDYQYKYVVSSYGVSFQYANTLEEIWTCLFKTNVELDSYILIRKLDYSEKIPGLRVELGDIIFQDSLENAIYWCLNRKFNPNGEID
jgi:hypothetical protein